MIKTSTQGHVIWLTGLPASGKTTIANALTERLHQQGVQTVILDGDEMRRTLSADLGFSPQDRQEHNRRVIGLAKLLIQNGIVVIAPLISPYRESRELARQELGRFLEVYVECPVEACIQRDPKGMYARALRGDLPNFTGISAPYEAPEHPDVTAQTDKISLDECVQRILECSASKNYLALDSLNGNRQGLPPSESNPGVTTEPLSEGHQPELTILMPCLNEREAIASCVKEAVQALEAAEIPGEVLVVDNGSTDGSQELAAAAGARVVQESKKGYGNAYLRGFREARGRYVIIGDSDGTYDFSLIPQFLAKLREGYEFVNGSRTRGPMEPGAMPFLHRYVGVPVLSWLLNRVSGARLSDAHCGMRGFTREAIVKMDLRTPGMEFASEIILQAARSGLRTGELPVPYRARRGESKLRTFSDGWRHLRFMLLYSPTHLFFAPGSLAFLLGMVVMLALVSGPIEVFGYSFDIHYMVVGSLLSILGYQLAMLGIYGRTYALSIGILRRDPLIHWAGRHLTLERGFIAGGLVLLVGLGLLVWILLTWIVQDFSFENDSLLRPALLGLTLAVIGSQTIFSSFFLSLLSINFGREPSLRGVAEEGERPLTVATSEV